MNQIKSDELNNNYPRLKHCDGRGSLAEAVSTSSLAKKNHVVVAKDLDRHTLGGAAEEVQG